MGQENRDIHERIYAFVLRVLHYTKKVPKSFENQVLLQQLYRSITSVGANDQEADGSLTKADFIHCYVIVRKEAKESIYWVRLLADTNTILVSNVDDILREGEEIVKIITTIIFKTRNRT